jgi:16S rRNA processing protein RimM
MLVAGRVGRPHGLDGSFHVVDPIPALLGEGTVLRAGDREATVQRRAGTDARPILRLDLAADRAAADALRGTELVVDREAAPALEEGEFWAADLEGCTVADGDRVLGTVTRLLALPSCEVLELDSGRLVPLVHDAVREIDVAARRIEVDAGFLGES